MCAKIAELSLSGEFGNFRQFLHTLPSNHADIIGELVMHSLTANETSVNVIILVCFVHSFFFF